MLEESRMAKQKKKAALVCLQTQLQRACSYFPSEISRLCLPLAGIYTYNQANRSFFALLCASAIVWIRVKPMKEHCA